MEEQQALLELLTVLGLSDREVLVMAALYEHPHITAQEIAKLTRIPRTSVYRSIERLLEDGFVTQSQEESTTFYQPVSASQLETTLKKKQLELERADALMSDVSSYLKSQLDSYKHVTKTLFYRGRSGIQQMNANILRAKSEILGYSFRDYEEAVGKKFQLWLYEELVIGKHRMRDLYSDAYLESLGTDQNEDYSTFFPGLEKCIESRYISPSVLAIEHQVDIYNDVVAMYNWRGSEVFGVEIYNKEIADMQRQLFELAWKVSKD